MTRLPIDDLLPQIIGHLRRFPNLVIEAPPGAGKTTRVPPALLGLSSGQILVLEPRRLAAKMAARRVAQELGEPAGQTAGYQVRFEEVASKQTRILFMTEGVLIRKLLAHPDLERVDLVILDEFHERHLDGDLALALLKRLQRTTRPKLRIVVMSATLQAAPIARYLDGCPVVRSEGRLFDLSITHLPYSAAGVERQVAGALEKLVVQQPSGDVLVFLPGAGEIRKTAQACEGLASTHDLLVLPLHGDLSPAEQDRAVAPAPRRKVILATNVAESSITIEGVTAVIDSGQARIASDSPWTGLPTLQVERISKASATQRAGRAARTSPGRVTRLYTAEDFARRRDFDTPEILRRELSQLLLQVRALGIPGVTNLDWLDAPPETAILAADRLLALLGATGEMAKRMAGYPLHPRLAKLVSEAMSRGAGNAGCAAAALLSSGARPKSCDLSSALEEDWDLRTRQHFDQIRRVVRPSRAVPQNKGPKNDGQRNSDALAMAVLAAFPDRVARRRREDQVLLATGGSALLAGAAQTGEFFVALDTEDRREKALPVIRLTSTIQAEWLLDLYPNRVVERTSIEWNRSAERAEAVSALVYDSLVIEESRTGEPDGLSELLAEKAIEAGIARFVDPDDLREALGRIEFAAQHSAVAMPDIPAVILAACKGLRSFSELKAAMGGFVPTLNQLAADVAPLRIRLQSGRATRVHYDPGKPPWIASRLQDFLGMTETPRVGNGTVPVVIHLLAPNQRPVQTTTDLAGFWSRLYPELRRELMRRYPKHAWPEKPA